MKKMLLKYVLNALKQMRKICVWKHCLFLSLCHLSILFDIDYGSL